MHNTIIYIYSYNVLLLLLLLLLYNLVFASVGSFPHTLMYAFELSEAAGRHVHETIL